MFTASRPVMPWMMNVVFSSIRMDMRYFTFSTARRAASDIATVRSA